MTTRVTVQIDGMTCGGCVASVRRVLAAMPGVTLGNVTIGTATMDIDPAKTTEAAVRDAIDGAGFTVRAYLPT